MSISDVQITLDKSVGRRGQPRIVIADDDDAIREQLVKLLSGDYDLAGAVSNGRELVDMARECRPDAVVVDISMQVTNGLEAVRLMKAEGIVPKIVFFTTNANPLYMRRAFSLGATGYVLKALGIEELPGALRIVLEGGTFISPALEI